MIIEKITDLGLFNLFKEIISIDQYYASKGKSDQSSQLDGRVRLGDKINAILDSITISLHLKDLTLFDLYTLNQISPHHDYWYDGIGFNVFGQSVDINGYPDIKHYINETKSVMNGIKSEYMDKNMKELFYPIGLFKYAGIIHFRGINILSLFDGFLEKFIYSNIKLENNEVSEKSVEITYQTIYKNFMDLFMKISYKNANKSSLIEDFIINKDIYSYIPLSYEKEFDFNIYKITCPNADVSINFFGTDDVKKINTSIQKISEYNEKINFNCDDFDFYFCCSLSIRAFLELYKSLKTYVHKSEIIDHQRFDILFSDTNYKFNIPHDAEKVYGTRINLMLNHNTECRNLIMSGNKINVVNHPINKYGMIISGQKIKFIIRMNLRDMMILNEERIKYGTEYIGKNKNRNFLCQLTDLSMNIWKNVFGLVW